MSFYVSTDKTLTQNPGLGTLDMSLETNWANGEMVMKKNLESSQNI